MIKTAQSRLNGAVIYQIYPRSFCDSNGDGVGDLPGIISKLDYLSGQADSLGVDTIWLSPFYPSPMADFGYDVTDHCSVDPLFGTLADFKQLLTAAHDRDLRVLVDFVPNHTSDEHPWFQEARSSKASKQRNWYVWRDPKPDGSPPNNWLSEFGGSAWEYDAPTGQYYLHSFLTKQPDLNWENPAVRDAMHQVMRFWLDLGVDGFRVDAVSWLSKDSEFRDDPINTAYRPNVGDDPHHALLPQYSKRGPQLFIRLREMAEIIRTYPGRFMITEAYPDNLATADTFYAEFYQHVDPAVSAPFNFEAITANWDAKEFRALIDQFQRDMHPDYSPVYCFGDHDQRRLASRFGAAAARTAAVLLLTLPGTPVLYYGDELGMVDGTIGTDQVRDPFALNNPDLDVGRDPERTPMLWSAENGAGFSTAAPWLPLNANYQTTNVAMELTDETSPLQLYRRLLALRRTSEALRSGLYRSLDVSNDTVFGYVRECDTQKITVLLNFSDQSRTVTGDDLAGAVILSTHQDTATDVHGSITLQPHEGLILT